jgi:hypothetical protein
VTLRTSKTRLRASESNIVAIDEFAAQRGLPDGVRSRLSNVVCQFLRGGPTGDGDGPLTDDVSEDVYRVFTVRHVIASGGDLCEVFASFLEVTKAQIADELYVALERLGADVKLLAIIGSWRDTLDDGQVLALLQEYNAGLPTLNRSH